MPFKTIFKYYWMQARKYKALLFGTFFFSAAGTLFDTAIQPFLYKKIIDTISSGFRTPEVITSLWKYFFLLLVTIILAQVFYRFRGYTIIATETKVMKDLTDFSFADLQRRSYQFFTNAFVGALVAKTKRFVYAWETLHDIIVFNVWEQLLRVGGIVVVLFFVHPPFGYFFLAWCAVYVPTVIFLARWKMKYNFAAAAEDSRVTAIFSDVLTNIFNLKMFASGKAETSGFQAATQRKAMANKTASVSSLMQWTVQGAFAGALQIISMYFAIRLWINGTISPGTIVLLQLYVMSITRGMWDLGRSLVQFVRALSDAAEMVEIFEQPIEVLDPISPEVCVIERGKVVFENVTFGYNPTNPVLKNFTLTVHAGERVGLVGSSGAGKTTITKLLLRFADVDEGEVSIDGQNIARITQDDLRRNIAYVPQDPVLFHRTLRENIAYGKPGASEGEIVDAARKAHAHEFISGFPHGYDTLVGERGVKLSGGERQRVAIARAILKNAPILVLDEATSSLDTLSEGLIQDALHTLMEGKTVIVIAHRLSTVRKMDRIVVLGKTGIQEQGSHNELLSLGGTYAAFWNHQTPARPTGGDGLLA